MTIIPAGLIESTYNLTTNSGEVRTYPVIINLAEVRMIKPNLGGQTVVSFARHTDVVDSIVLTESYDLFAARLFDKEAANAT